MLGVLHHARRRESRSISEPGRQRPQRARDEIQSRVRTTAGDLRFQALLNDPKSNAPLF
jgi:hypothetical protein